MENRLPTRFLMSSVFAAGLAAAALAAGQPVLAQSAPPPDFGAAPPGEIPILFNDRHVYAKPDRLRAGRVLAALVKNGTILVPLRSLFEQTGATVSYDKATKTVEVSKAGADVKVTVGKPIVSINGEDRPLDVPPEIYKGALVVPLRVISEGMGAYVLWVADKRLVVVRYNPAPPPTPEPTAPPTPLTTPAPSPKPTATPAPTAVPYHYEAFVAGDYDISPTVYNELSSGNKGKDAYTIKGGIELPVAGADVLLEGDYRHLQYPHDSDAGASACVAGSAACGTVNGSDPNYQSGLCPSGDPGCVTVVGYQNIVNAIGLGQAYVPGFEATEDDVDAHVAIKVASPRIFVGGAFYDKSYNYLGYPKLSGFGVGGEKIPDFENPLSLYGSVYYYPTISGNYTYPTSVFLPASISGQTIKLSYSMLKYSVGATIDLGKSPLYIDLGFAGEHAVAKQNAPSNTSVTSPYAGLGLHF